MKKTSKIIAMVLVLAMVLAMGAITALADGTDGTITIPNATLGVTYHAYKVFDATLDGTKIAYTADATLFAALGGSEGTNLTAGPFTISGTKDASGNFNVQLTDPTTDADTITAWIKTNLSKFTEVAATSGLNSSKEATASTVVYDNLAYGYYFVTSGLGTVVSVDSANPDVTIKDKNTQEPTGPEKLITKEDAVINTSDDTFTPGVESNDAAVGTTQSFSITYNATNYVTSGTGTGVTSNQVTKFYIVDTPNNMTIDKNTVKVVVKDAAGDVTVINNGAVVNNTTYPATISLATGDEKPLNITIDWAKAGNNIYHADDGAANIQVILTYDALVLTDAATENASNTVDVKYDRTGATNQDVGTDSTETDTYHFLLTKTDAADDSPLTGAKFELTLGSTKVSVIDVNGDGSVYRVAGSGETGVTTIDMKNNSSIEIRGLDKQDYSLTEIEAPSGYNLLTSPVAVPAASLVKADAAASGCTIDVDNNKGTELPETGGIGTTIFYVVGAILIVGAIVLLVTRRRMSAK